MEAASYRVTVDSGIILNRHQFRDFCLVCDLYLRERLFHIHNVHRYQLYTKYLYPSTLLWQINGCNLKQQPGIIHWCYLFRCRKFNDVWLNIGVFCAAGIVEGSAPSFAGGAAEVIQVQVQILYCLLYMARHVSGFMQQSVTHTHTKT